jgi:flagellar hook protein FlgE
MSFSFNTALSGLKANSAALNVIGNNIANSNTIGFRSSAITFQDIFATRFGSRMNGAGNSLGIGNGVQTAAVHTNFSQGSINESSSPLHAAIQGNGFFVVQGQDGRQGYTRAGDFTVNSEGMLVSPTGAEVQGFTAIDGAIPPGAGLSSLKLPIGEIYPPKMTTNATIKFNLDSRMVEDASYTINVPVYDSLGTKRNLAMKFTKQEDDSYLMTATLDGVEAEVDADGAGPTTDGVTFLFDENGKLVTPEESLQIIPDQEALGLAVLPKIDINLYELDEEGEPTASYVTSFAKASGASSTQQDGYGAGDLDNVAVDADGKIFGLYSNGQSRLLGQYALAVFDSNAGLAHMGANMFTETVASGAPSIGTANSGTRGQISGGYLEQSNVNITDEFVELIEAQRGFQANSRVISTANQTFQDLLQMV